MSWVIGTAGHIDHGKTSLVRALTGIDTDRLKEEKERGITIELGFAHLDLSTEKLGVVGVVDVPGHERFLRAMVAGAAGIDAVVLVVAADEGVMPQTREHLDVCRLLDVRRGVVALTKCDAVDEEMRALAVMDVGEVLRGTALEGAAIVACSSKTGEGLGELRGAIADLLRAAPERSADGSARLPLDRVFSMKGHGTVVTGTLWSGRLKPGDDVVALPGGARGKIRGVQVHGASVDEARAGQRTAVNVSFAREAVERGQTLVVDGTLTDGKLLDVRLAWLPTTSAPLKRRSRALVHIGTRQTLATVTLLDRGELVPGGDALAQVHLDEPVVALPGDRFIVRGFSLQKQHRSTVGGGVVLRVLGPRQRRGTPEAVERLKAAERALADPVARVELEVGWSALGGRTPRELAARLPFTPRAIDKAIDELSRTRRLVRFDKERGALVHSDALAIARATLAAAVDDFHARSPLLPGVPREALRGRLPEGVSAKLFHLVVEGLVAAGELVADKDLVRRPTHDHAASHKAKGLAPLAERVLALYVAAGTSPPRPAEAQATLAVSADALKEALDLLVREGALARVQDLFFAEKTLAGLRAQLTAFLQTHAEINAQQWKDLVGATRKFTIPLAERFDAEKLTLRVGDIRRLRK